MTKFYGTPDKDILIPEISQYFPHFQNNVLHDYGIQRHNISHDELTIIIKEISKEVGYYEGDSTKQLKAIIDYVEQHGSHTLSVILQSPYFYRLINQRLWDCDLHWNQSAVCLSALQSVWVNKMCKYNIIRLSPMSPKEIIDQITQFTEDTQLLSGETMAILNHIQKNIDILIPILLHYPSYKSRLIDIVKNQVSNTNNQNIIKILAFLSLNALGLEDIHNMTIFKNLKIRFSQAQLDDIIARELDNFYFSNEEIHLINIEILQTFGAYLDDKQLTQVANNNFQQLSFYKLNKLKEWGAEVDPKKLADANKSSWSESDHAEQGRHINSI